MKKLTKLQRKALEALGQQSELLSAARMGTTPTTLTELVQMGLADPAGYSPKGGHSYWRITDAGRQKLEAAP